MSNTAVLPDACTDAARSTPRTRPRKLTTGLMPDAMADNGLGLEVLAGTTLRDTVQRSVGVLYEMDCHCNVYPKGSGK